MLERFNLSNILATFHFVMIYPFSCKIFSDAPFLPSEVTDRQLLGKGGPPITNSQTNNQENSLSKPPFRLPKEIRPFPSSALLETPGELQKGLKLQCGETNQKEETEI